MLGIVQEQHPSRTRLFMQWQQMDWPVMVDSLNLLGVEVVPRTLLVDEAGIVRSTRPSFDDLETFLAAPPAEHPRAVPAPVPPLPDKPGAGSRALHEFAETLFLWGGEERLTGAIDAYRQLVEMNPGDGAAWFRLGAALRRRYDSADRRPGDFQRASESWSTALATQPNQYIWRRRIQQYGPRLAKPYPFYDWVGEARREILARGETPIELPVEPAGAELAQPAKRLTTADPGTEPPDAGGAIHRDKKGWVQVETTLVPAVVVSGDGVRVHLVFRPNTRLGAHWNNESEGLTFWLEPPTGWQTAAKLLTLPNPQSAISSEERAIELELAAPTDFTGVARFAGYALYYVCEDLDSTCLYRRQDVTFDIDVRPAERTAG